MFKDMFEDRLWGAAEILRGSPYVQHVYLGNYSFVAVFVHGGKVYVMLVEDYAKRIRLFLARVLYRFVKGVIEKDYRRAIYEFISECIRKSCGAEEDPMKKYKMLSEIEFMVGEYAPHFEFAAAFDVDEKDITFSNCDTVLAFKIFETEKEIIYLPYVGYC